jgi:hypothetical protein
MGRDLIHSTGELKYQNGDFTSSAKIHHHDAEPVVNPCGGCNACLQMTAIHRKGENSSWSGEGGEGPNLTKPCATHFFQRNLGNSYLQSAAETHTTSPGPINQTPAPTIQRKCNCGGSGDHCSNEEEEHAEI